MSDQPCEKHELAWCGECSGAAARFEESIKEDRTPFDSSHLPPGVALSAYPGQCAGCAQNYGRESPIRYDDRAPGWVALACCG